MLRFQFAKGSRLERGAKFLDMTLAKWKASVEEKLAEGKERGFGFTGDQRAYGNAIGKVRSSVPDGPGGSAG